MFNNTFATCDFSDLGEIQAEPVIDFYTLLEELNVECAAIICREDVGSPKVARVLRCPEHKSENDVKEKLACILGLQPDLINSVVAGSRVPMKLNEIANMDPAYGAHCQEALRALLEKKSVDSVSFPLHCLVPHTYCLIRGQEFTSAEILQLEEVLFNVSVLLDGLSCFANILLSEHEMKVLQLSANGCCNQDIANTLGIREVTVRFHLSKAKEKLGLSTNQQARIFFSQSYGWCSPS